MKKIKGKIKEVREKLVSINPVYEKVIDDQFFNTVKEYTVKIEDSENDFTISTQVEELNNRLESDFQIDSVDGTFQIYMGAITYITLTGGDIDELIILE